MDHLWDDGNGFMLMFCTEGKCCHLFPTLQNLSFVGHNPDAKLSLFWTQNDVRIVGVRESMPDFARAIECFFQVAVQKRGLGNRIYVLNHYSAGVILDGNRTAVRRQTLPKVNFENYLAVISFVNVSGNHWKFLYIHAPTCQVFIVDPAGHGESQDSEHAAFRFRDYFKMRRTCHTKEDWVGIKWRGGVIQHPVQEDNFSCGVLVMEMAKEVLESFPEIPTMKFGTSKAEMANRRREMAEQILEASVLDEANTCAMCATVRPPGPGPPLTDWIECGKCQRWYHVQCLGLTTQQFNQVKERKWNCCLCC